MTAVAVVILVCSLVQLVCSLLIVRYNRRTLNALRRVETSNGRRCAECRALLPFHFDDCSKSAR